MVLDNLQDQVTFPGIVPYLDVKLGKDGGIISDHQKSSVSKVEDIIVRRVEMEAKLIDRYELY